MKMLVIGESDEFEQGDLMLIKFDVERSFFVLFYP